MLYNIPKIEKPISGRRFAIGDIHGCYETFLALLEQLKIKKTDQIFLLGDLIDKGKESKKVVDYTLKMQALGYQFYVLKGNHEKSFLTAYECGFDFFERYLHETNCIDFLNENLEQYLRFFSELEYAYDLGDYLLSHAEFLVDEKSLYRGMKGLFSNVQFDISEAEILNKKQVVGHFTKTVTTIHKNIQNNGRLIYLDTGCVYINEVGLGYLSALNLDTLELYIQKNID